MNLRGILKVCYLSIHILLSILFFLLSYENKSNNNNKKGRSYNSDKIGLQYRGYVSEFIRVSV